MHRKWYYLRFDAKEELFALEDLALLRRMERIPWLEKSECKKLGKFICLRFKEKGLRFGWIRTDFQG